MMLSPTYFCSLWLDPAINVEFPDWREWLQEVPGNPRQAKCLVCPTIIELSNMGKGAVISHTTSKKHERMLKAKRSQPSVAFFAQRANSSTSTSEGGGTATAAAAGSSSQVTSSSIPVTVGAASAAGSSQQVASSTISFGSDKTTLAAEILWSMQVIKTHQSFRSQEGISKVFQRMFPDSGIAAGMQLSRTKASYLVTHGLVLI